MRSSPCGHIALIMSSTPTYADQLARARALLPAGLPVPQDLAAWMIEQLEQACSLEYLRVKRDMHLIVAGEMIGGSIRQRANSIMATDAWLSANWEQRKLDKLDLSTSKGRIHAARLLGSIPRNRQLRNILKSWAAGDVAIAH